MAPVAGSITSPAGNALNVPPTAPVVASVVVPEAQNVPPLTVAVGLFDTVTCEVAVPVHGAVPKLYVIVYVLGVDAARSIAPVFASITRPAGVAEKVPPVAPVVASVVVPVAQNAPPLTVAVGLFDTVTCEVAVPVHGAVPKLYVIVYVLAADAPRSIAPVVASITSPAGVAENVPPTAPVVVNVVVPEAQNVPPLTVAVGLFDIVTCEVAVPVHGAVPKLYVTVYVLAADAPRSITPVAGSITSPAGNALNVPPVAPVVVSVVVPVVQNAPPLTVAVGLFDIVTCEVAVPVHGAVPKL